MRQFECARVAMCYNVGMRERCTKAELRKAAIARRHAASADELREAGERLVTAGERLAHALAPRSTVAAYVSMGTEIPTSPLIASLLSAGHRVIVPRLGTGLEIGWGEVGDVDALHAMPPFASGRARPLEPQTPVLAADALAEASLILAPAFAVDRSGTRLGRGGGWYDRALTHRRADARLIAVCWPWELLDTPIPRERHDVPFDEILTTTRLADIAQITPGQHGGTPERCAA